jgi:ABC-type oligopeptide transport system substrate-binding subunit
MYNQFNPYYESVEVLDPLTLKINFNQPAPHAADLLALLAVADPDMFIKDDGSEALGNEEDKQIASGAFKMVEYVPDSHIYFEGYGQ